MNKLEDLVLSFNLVEIRENKRGFFFCFVRAEGEFFSLG